MNDQLNLVEVYRAQNGPQAHILRTALEDAGIRAVVDGDVLQGDIGVTPAGWSGAPRVLVESHDEARALEIVSRMDLSVARESSDASPRCLSCGAPMSESETSCPACGWSHMDAGEMES
jgi:hypothetical protein